MELNLFIHGNDTCFQVDFEPDVGIEEIRISDFHPEGLSVGTGTFPDIKTVPLLEELNRLASIAFADHREEWLDMRRESYLEYRYDKDHEK